MPKYENKERSKSKTKDEEITELPEVEDTSERDAAIDDLLDEIDDVLEENAEQFVAQYTQRGGQ